MNKWHGGSAGNEHTISEADIETLLSHQFRTPLSAIKWHTEMMLDGDIGQLTPQQRSYLEQIFAGYQQTAAVINELLQNSALRANVRHIQGSLISNKEGETT